MLETDRSLQIGLFKMSPVIREVVSVPGPNLRCLRCNRNCSEEVKVDEIQLRNDLKKFWFLRKAQYRYWGATIATEGKCQRENDHMID